MSSPFSYIKFRYTKGLCNNLFKLFTAARIAELERKQLIEPIFRWGRHPPVRFSELYDLRFFNTQMRVGDKPMIVFEDAVDPELVDDRSLTYDLWKGSRHVYDVHHQRAHNRIPRQCPSVRVLRALRVNPKFRAPVDAQPRSPAIHVRWEPEWVAHAAKRQPGLPDDETMLVPLDRIAEMYASDFNVPVFFTTGMKHTEAQAVFAGHGVTTSYCYDKALPYEVNAAINFAICVRAPVFIGNSRSTFSNLISLARHLEGTGPSYIYNYKDRLIRRVDAGLHCEAPKVVSKYVTIEDQS